VFINFVESLHLGVIVSVVINLVMMEFVVVKRLRVVVSTQQAHDFRACFDTQTMRVMIVVCFRLIDCVDFIAGFDCIASWWRHTWQFGRRQRRREEFVDEQKTFLVV
jgi:hypothetical protein